MLHGRPAAIRGKLFAIGIGAPGMTDVTAGRVISATNLAGWTDVPLRDLVQARFAAPVQRGQRRQHGGARRALAGRGAHGERFRLPRARRRRRRRHHDRRPAASRPSLVRRRNQPDDARLPRVAGRLRRSRIPREPDQRRGDSRLGAREARRRARRPRSRSRDADDLRRRAPWRCRGARRGRGARHLPRQRRRQYRRRARSGARRVRRRSESRRRSARSDPVRRVVSRIVPNVPTLAISALGDDAPLLGQRVFGDGSWRKRDCSHAASAIAGSARSPRSAQTRRWLFSPDYVRLVLNENFEDAKTLLLDAADGDPLRPSRDARRDAASCRRADARRLRDALRRHRSRRRARGDVTTAPARICSSTWTADRRRLRRRRRGTAAHRAQPQRHRHDDVPDAAARATCSTLTASTSALRGVARRRSPSGIVGDHLPRAHAHAAGAADDGRALPAGGHRGARARHDAAVRRVSQRRIAIRWARARSRARDFRSIASGRATCSASTVRRATRTAASRRSTISSRARRRAGDTLRRRRAGSSRTCCSGARRKSAICGCRTASCR